MKITRRDNKKATWYLMLLSSILVSLFLTQCQKDVTFELSVTNWQNSIRIYLDTCVVSDSIVRNEPHLSYGFSSRQEAIDIIKTLSLNIHGRDNISAKYPFILIEYAAQGSCVYDVFNLYTHKNDTIYHFVYTNGCIDGVGWALKDYCLSKNWKSFSIAMSKEVHQLRGSLLIKDGQMLSGAIVSFISMDNIIAYPLSLNEIEYERLANNIELKTLCDVELDLQNSH